MPEHQPHHIKAEEVEVKWVPVNHEYLAAVEEAQRLWNITDGYRRWPFDNWGKHGYMAVTRSQTRLRQKIFQQPGPDVLNPVTGKHSIPSATLVHRRDQQRIQRREAARNPLNRGSKKGKQAKSLFAMYVEHSLRVRKCCREQAAMSKHIQRTRRTRSPVADSLDG